MVEDKHSVNKILSFGAKSISPEILEQLLIGRANTANYLFEAVKSIAEFGNNQQILVIGQRGMGKTHLLKILHSRIQGYVNDSKIVVAYFSEEEYGVANYFDFLVRIINALIKWNDNDRAYLLEKMNELQETQTKSQVYVAEKIIEDYIDKRPLVILAENFSDILESIKVSDQGKLRAWLYKVNKINIIATSQALSDDFEKEDRPFFGFFNVYYLKNLSFEESLDFLKSMAKIEHKTEVIEFLEGKGVPQVKALHQLVKGNHRLLVTFYEFLKADTLVNLSVNFIKTINDLKPYYETYIRYLPAQQQKIVRYIALCRKPQQGKDIAKNCFIDPTSLSKQLSELARKHLLEVITDPDDKRNKLYDIDEPLLRISIEVGEHREGISAIFIDFLAIYYNSNELDSRKKKFYELIEKCKNEEDRQKYFYEIFAIEKALHLKRTIYAEIEELSYMEKYKNQFNIPDYIKLQELIKTAVDENFTNFYLELDRFISETEKMYEKIIIIKSEFASNVKDASDHKIIALLSLLIGQKNEDTILLNESIENFEKASLLDPSDESFIGVWALAIHKLAVLKDEELFEKSIYILRKHKNILKTDFFANYIYGLNYLRIRSSFFDSKYFTKSIQHIKKSIQLNPEFSSAYTILVRSILYLSILNNDKNILIEAFENIKEGYKLKQIDKGFYPILVLYFLEVSKIEEENTIVNQIIQLTEIANYNIEKVLELLSIIDVLRTIINKEKISIISYNLYRKISPTLEFNNNLLARLIFIHNINIFKDFIARIELNAKNFEMVNFWIHSIMSSSHSLTIEDISFLKSTIQPCIKEYETFNITYIYLDTYQKYLIEGDTKAIYDLPKEQRLFFENEILGLKR